jgi:hypothetical protein
VSNFLTKKFLQSKSEKKVLFLGQKNIFTGKFGMKKFWGLIFGGKIFGA